MVLRVTLLFFAALVAIVLCVFVALGLLAARDNYKLREIHETFPGLSRAQAYAKLAAMNLTARSGYGDPDGGAGGGAYGADWPDRGEAAVDLKFVGRSSYGCGNHAIALLRFKGDRVEAVKESIVTAACL
jgi:hypothetical protein